MLCGPVKVNRRSDETYRLHLQGQRVTKQETSVKQAAQFDFSTLKMEAIFCPEKCIGFRRNTQRYIP
jgi:hypothetical protein